MVVPKMAASTAAASNMAHDFVDFVNASPTPFHVVRTAGQRLAAAGFVVLSERDAWAGKITAGGKYYLTRNGSSIVAFVVGRKWRLGGPAAIVGAHTDSPCLRVKPASRRTGAGFSQVGVETYGGGLWHTWFDRDLSVAGRALVRDPATAVFTQRLVELARPVLRIPTLAIHLERGPEFNPNKETHLFPIAGLAEAELNKQPAGKAADSEPNEQDHAEFYPLKPMAERHHPKLLGAVAASLDVDPADLADFELLLHDTQPACLGGLDDEFIFAPRLDNLGMTYCAVTAIIASVAAGDDGKDNDKAAGDDGKDANDGKDNTNDTDDDATIRVAVCFDHEEVGSVSAYGAASTLLPDVLRRISRAWPETGDDAATAFEQTMARSFLISADMAHSVHPNYPAKYEASHQPLLNSGPVIKVNANQRYATNSPGIVLVQECARLAAVPLQLFVVRNDSPCGSTIGPTLSAELGVRTLDLGNAMLSMHSIRETAGARDVAYGVRLFEHFFRSYGQLERRIVVD